MSFSIHSTDILFGANVGKMTPPLTFFKGVYFMCMIILPICVYGYYVSACYSWRSEEGIGFLGTGVPDGSKPPTKWALGSKPDPL